MVECEKCKNENGAGEIKSTLSASHNPSNNCCERGSHNCSICNTITSGIYIKDHSCHLINPDRRIGWVCFQCGAVEMDLYWFNPQSINKVIGEVAEREIENKYNNELEFWLKELERAKEQNDRFSYDQAKKQIKKFLEE